MGLIDHPIGIFGLLYGYNDLNLFNLSSQDA